MKVKTCLLLQNAHSFLTGPSRLLRPCRYKATSKKHRLQSRHLAFHHQGSGTLQQPGLQPTNKVMRPASSVCGTLSLPRMEVYRDLLLATQLRQILAKLRIRRRLSRTETKATRVSAAFLGASMKKNSLVFTIFQER